MGKNREHKRALVSLGLQVIAVIIVFIAAYALPVVLGGMSGVGDLIASVPWLVYGSLLWLLGNVLSLKKPFKLAVQVAGLIILSFGLVSFGRTSGLPPSDKPRITVCSYNSEYFFFRKRREAFEKLSKLDCDVVLLQEVFLANRVYKDEIAQLTKEFFPDYHVATGGEFITLVKGQILGKHLPKHEGFLYTHVKVKNENFQIYNVHIWNPLAKRFTASFEQVEKHGGPFKVYMPWSVRKAQVEQLRAAIAKKQPDRVIIAGDFNTPPTHPLIAFRLFDKNKKLYKVGRLGIGGTFYSLVPLLEIDHVFVSRDLSVYDYERINLGFSDHLLIKFRISLEAKTKTRKI